MNHLSHSFASDNYSGIHPTILQAISDANCGHDYAYGTDAWTDKLNDLVKQHFGKGTAYPVFNGTGANITALTAMLPRFGAVICTDKGHIYNDESNAPECVGGFRMFTIPTEDGKLTPELIDTQAYGFGKEHRSQPAIVHLAMTTEVGTCYSLDELRAIVAHAKKLGLYTYIDGARLSNACAYLNCTLKDIADTGVDMLSLGGTKNGLMLGECIVVLNDEFDANMKYMRKMTMQLSSKMRFISAQFVTWLESGLWLELAKHSNEMARHLANQIQNLDGVTITQKVQSNAVFVILPKQTVAKLHEDFYFYDWNEFTGEIRLMMGFDTTIAQVDELANKIKAYLP
ncbi:low specificity L-threonine aldolase [Moraxella nasovis]|uniref:threonine aldolase family protein n=1 Tax=Moraxella nasovis TaxID=2904121 RepID=UPI001F609EBB|nr:low specificity L-threonine aldolase [Moraxella nasovis]UNU74009.1 low specificity L-threonine aldolase [Moraxella nasovis]